MQPPDLKTSTSELNPLREKRKAKRGASRAPTPALPVACLPGLMFKDYLSGTVPALKVHYLSMFARTDEPVWEFHKVWDDVDKEVAVAMHSVDEAALHERVLSAFDNNAQRMIKPAGIRLYQQSLYHDEEPPETVQRVAAIVQQQELELRAAS